MKLNKKQKIITSLIGSGAILGLSLAISIPLLISRSGDSADVKKSIKSKIQNKNLIIPKSVNTYSDSEISLAIKNQLKLKNPSLTKDDLSKITDNIWHLKPGKKTLVTLKIKLNSGIDSININVIKEKNIKLWTKNSAVATSSNISNGVFSSFIQDSSGNLWSMGGSIDSKLQVLERDGTQWKQVTNSGLTNASNITIGRNGTIFEDDFGNLWAMGFDKKLQILVKNKDGTYANSWVNNNDMNTGDKWLKNSAIEFGTGGTIFQDSFGNLWAMGYGALLQVLVKNKDGTYADLWNCDNTKGLLKNSNIANTIDLNYIGKYGRIFQDSFGNLWSMGKNSKLQVLKADPKSDTGYVNTGWVNDNTENGDPLLKNSNIILGQDGTIFQDSFGNLWTSGGGLKVQVLKVKSDGSGYVETGWTCDNSANGEPLLKGSNIEVVKTKKGFAGNPVKRIFQDSFGNLWMQGHGKKSQVLEVNQNGDGYVETGWSSNNNSVNGHKLLKNLKISSNVGWVFFQDSSKNLWAMGNRSKLQVLKANQNGDGYVDSWTDNNAENGEILLKESIITNGFEGKIFEDSSKNLWAIGYNSVLQVYDKTQKKWIS